MFFKFFTSAMASVLMVSGCGGAESSTSGISEFALRVDASAAVAGVEWTMSSSSVALDRQQISEGARAAWGPQVRVLFRAAPQDADDQTWLVFSQTAVSLATFDLIRREAVNEASLPDIGAVMCADAQGNPVRCGLKWVAL